MDLPPRSLAWDLEENAEGFIREAVKYVESGVEHDWVFAVVNLATALELALKAILRAEHWSLLFDEAGSASAEALRTGRFKSVGFQEALRRCQDIADVELEEKDVRYLRHVHELRNQVLHYEFSLKIEQVKGVVARGLNIFNQLYTRHIKRGSSLSTEISGRLVEFDKYVDERMRRLEPRLKRSKRPPGRFRECPDCRQYALVVRDGIPECLFCGATAEARELARYGEADEGPCSNCENGRLTFLLVNNDEGYTVCVLCGYRESGQKRTCSYCGESFWDDDPEGLDVCPDCLSYRLAKD